MPASEPRYRILFHGVARPGTSLNRLRMDLQAVFCLRDDVLDQLFCGRPVVIKGDADAETAARFKSTIEGLGGICWFEPRPEDGAPYADRRVDQRRKIVRRRKAERPGAIQPDRRKGAGRRWTDGSASS